MGNMEYNVNTMYINKYEIALITLSFCELIFEKQKYRKKEEPFMWGIPCIQYFHSGYFHFHIVEGNTIKKCDSTKIVSQIVVFTIIALFLQ